jgi:hypothetical protein
VLLPQAKHEIEVWHLALARVFFGLSEDDFDFPEPDFSWSGLRFSH